jgi:O-antigen ligase
LAFGPLIYAESHGTVAAMLLLAGAALVVPRPRGVPVVAKTIRALAVMAPLLAWMLASVTWSLDGEASAGLMLRFCALLSAGALFVTCFDVLPLARLHRPLAALAVGLSAAGAAAAADILLGGHLARVLHGPLLEGFDPALEYGRAATLHAILLIPIFIGLLRLRAPRLAAGYALLGATAILETSSLSAKTALAVGVLCFVVVFILPQLRWVGLAVLGFGAVALPAMLPMTLDPEVTCWLADHKPSALHRLEIWSFVAERIEQRPIAGWGLDAARRLPGGTAPVIIRHCDTAGRPHDVALSSVILPLHPHNAILQLWLELGGVGMVLGVGPLIVLFQHVFRAAAWRSRLAQATISGSAAAAVPVALVSFGIWQEWFLSGLFVVAAFVVLAARLSGAASEDTILSRAGALGVD